MSLPALSSLSVGSKLAVSTVALLAMVSALVYVGLTRHEREALLESKESAGRMVVELFAAASAAPIEFEDTESIQNELKHLALNSQVIYAAVWGKGAEGDGLLGEPQGESQAVAGDAKLFGKFVRDEQQALEVEAPAFGATKITRLSDRIVFEWPIADSLKANIGVTRVEFSLAAENAKFAVSERNIMLGSLGIALAIASLLIGISRSAIVKPLGALVQATVNLQQGEAVAIKVRSDDEVGRLTRAFMAMADAIRQREQEITARNEDMRLVLDNVSQGFITVDRDGMMSAERSRIVAEWLGESRDGETIWDYIMRSDARAGDWFSLSFESLLEGFIPLEVGLGQMPRLMQFDNKHFGIEYIPVGGNGDDIEFEQLVVVISDITSEVEARVAERSQRELLTIFDCFNKDKAAFLRFYEDGCELMAAIRKRDEGNSKLLLRHIHTLKGNSAIFGISSVSDHCHELETEMMESGRMPEQAEIERLIELWAAIEAKVQKFIGGNTRVRSLDVLEEDYSALLDAIHKEAQHSDLAAMVNRWRYESTAVILERVAEQVRSVAERLARSDIRVETDSHGLWLDPDRWGKFWSNFIHVVRNSVDHGIEYPEEREAQGKGQGVVRIETCLKDDRFLVLASDNGRGIDWDKLAEKGKEHGLAHETRQDLIRVMMSDGVSTRDEVTEHSGRGVGMAAVLEACRALAGDIEVESLPGKGTTFRFSFPIPSMYDEAPEETADAGRKLAS